MRDDLGNWIRRRYKKGVQGQKRAAQAVLDECEIPLSTLRDQWALQQVSQLSLRARKSLLCTLIMLD